MTAATVAIKGRFETAENATLFIDAFNEWARHPEIDALFSRTDDTPSGYPESDYRIVQVQHGGTRMNAQRFVVTGEHLALLRRMYVGWCSDEYGAPEIDPKRPYGNSAVAEDIHEILTGNDGPGRGNGDLTKEQREVYRKLHLETQTALQIVLRTGSFEEGAYEADAYMTNWEKVS